MKHVASSELRAAAASERLQRRESGWNNHVHTPLLELVFGSVPPTRLEFEQSQRRVATRAEAVMSATIAGNPVPFVLQDDHQQQQDPFACSVSLNNSEKSLDNTEKGSEVEGEDGDVDAESPDQVHSRSRSRKVDYLVVLDILDIDPLHEAVRKASFETSTGKLHVNQN